MRAESILPAVLKTCYWATAGLELGHHMPPGKLSVFLNWTSNSFFNEHFTCFQRIFRIFVQWYFLRLLQIFDSFLEYFVLHRHKKAEVSGQMGKNYWKLLHFTLMNCNTVIWIESQSFSKIFSEIVTMDRAFIFAINQHSTLNTILTKRAFLMRGPWGIHDFLRWSEG